MHSICTRCRRPLAGSVAAARGLGDTCYRRALDAIRVSDIQLTNDALIVDPTAPFSLGPDRAKTILVAFTANREFAELWEQDFEATFLGACGRHDTIEIKSIVSWIKTRPQRFRSGDAIIEQLSTDTIAPAVEPEREAPVAAHAKRRYRVHAPPSTSIPVQDTLF